MFPTKMHTAVYFSQLFISPKPSLSFCRIIAIVGSIVGLAVLVGIIVAIVCCCCRKQTSHQGVVIRPPGQGTVQSPAVPTAVNLPMGECYNFPRSHQCL